MNGLSEEYDSFVTSVTSRMDPYNVEDIEALLLAQEEHLEKHRSTEQLILQANLTSGPPFKNYSSRTPTRFSGNNNRGKIGNLKNNGSPKRNFGNNFSSKNWRPSQSSSSSSNSRIQCQICNKFGLLQCIVGIGMIMIFLLI